MATSPDRTTPDVKHPPVTSGSFQIQFTRKRVSDVLSWIILLKTNERPFEYFLERCFQVTQAPLLSYSTEKAEPNPLFQPMSDCWGPLPASRSCWQEFRQFNMLIVRLIHFMWHSGEFTVIDKIPQRTYNRYDVAKSLIKGKRSHVGCDVRVRKSDGLSVPSHSSLIFPSNAELCSAALVKRRISLSPTSIAQPRFL